MTRLEMSNVLNPVDTRDEDVQVFELDFTRDTFAQKHHFSLELPELPETKNRKKQRQKPLNEIATHLLKTFDKGVNNNSIAEALLNLAETYKKVEDNKYYRKPGNYSLNSSKHGTSSGPISSEDVVEEALINNERNDIPLAEENSKVAEVAIVNENVHGDLNLEILSGPQWRAQDDGFSETTQSDSHLMEDEIDVAASNSENVGERNLEGDHSGSQEIQANIFSYRLVTFSFSR
ncbi:hypothetical protein FQA39_LY15285 [Lamprigera yunnana]|nr:hypothetical protein FQA39_LY15285 [Lamprigera yunnana]